MNGYYNQGKLAGKEAADDLLRQASELISEEELNEELSVRINALYQTKEEEQYIKGFLAGFLDMFYEYN